MNKLKLTRIMQGISQYALQAKTGIQQSKISLMENNLYFPKNKEKEKLAMVLGVTIDELFPENVRNGMCQEIES